MGSSSRARHLAAGRKVTYAALKCLLDATCGISGISGIYRNFLLGVKWDCETPRSTVPCLGRQPPAAPAAPAAAGAVRGLYRGLRPSALRRAGAAGRVQSCGVRLKVPVRLSPLASLGREVGSPYRHLLPGSEANEELPVRPEMPCIRPTGVSFSRHASSYRRMTARTVTLRRSPVIFAWF